MSRGDSITIPYLSISSDYEWNFAAVEHVHSITFNSRSWAYAHVPGACEKEAPGGCHSLEGVVDSRYAFVGAVRSIVSREIQRDHILHASYAS